MSLDLAFDAGQEAVAETLAAWCREHADVERVKARTDEFDAVAWRALADLGVLALATPDGEGGALEIVAALESLGAAGFSGPLPATFLATQLLPAAERARVTAGEWVVSVGAPPLWPWGEVAKIHLELEEEAAFRAQLEETGASVATLGGEPWLRAAHRRGEALGNALRARALGDLARAAYLSAAAGRLVFAAAEHARTRRQFGRAIGEFQAVAHPLADADIDLAAARSLARVAAWCWDEDRGDAPLRAAAARQSATRAALATADTVHQTFGAIGISLEGPVFHLSRRIRQRASEPPDGAHAQALLAADALAAGGATDV